MKKSFETEIKQMFKALNERLERINQERADEEDFRLPKAEIRLLGQMSLLANEKVAAILSLAQTGDVDALLKMNNVVKREFENILKEHNLICSEESEKVWIPPKSKFLDLVQLSAITVKLIDPESALVSKAVKAPKKNLQLIREAIASGEFPGLVKRVEENGGKLEIFA